MIEVTEESMSTYSLRLTGNDDDYELLIIPNRSKERESTLIFTQYGATSHETITLPDAASLGRNESLEKHYQQILDRVHKWINSAPDARPVYKMTTEDIGQLDVLIWTLYEIL